MGPHSFGGRPLNQLVGHQCAGLFAGIGPVPERHGLPGARMHRHERHAPQDGLTGPGERKAALHREHRVQHKAACSGQRPNLTEQRHGRVFNSAEPLDALLLRSWTTTRAQWS